MKNEKLSFVYFGSGPVAAENLRLLREHFTVEAVITKPTTEQEMRAACPDTPLYCVSNKHELDALIKTMAFSSQVGVLIDFGIIVSNDVISHFEKGIVNSHFSLLPQWRGADPITFSILSGQERTGVSLMLLVEKMDEGPIIGISTYKFKGDETTPELTARLITLSNSLLVEMLAKYVNGDIIPASQLDVAQSLGLSTQPSYSRKLSKNDGLLDWSKPAEALVREVRAYSGWPKSRARLADVDIVVTKASAIAADLRHETIGTIQITADKELLITTAQGIFKIEQLKPAGKKEMDARSFLAGYANRLTT